MDAPLKLELIPDSDPRLHVRCDFVNLNKLDFPLFAMVPVMIQIMKDNNGIGLAAPQVGYTKRFFVMQTGPDRYETIINPTILALRDRKGGKSGPEKRSEGCLSYPGLWLDVPRWYQVRGSWIDPNGRRHTAWLKETEAQVFQHESDHLEGVVFTQR